MNKFTVGLIVYLSIFNLSESSAQNDPFSNYHSHISSHIKSLEYKGTIRGRVFNTPEGEIRIHERSFQGALFRRKLEVKHLDSEGNSRFDTKHSTVCVSPEMVESYNNFNRTLWFSKVLNQLENNEKLTNPFFDFYIFAVGWIPECNSKKSVMNRAIEMETPFALIAKSESKKKISDSESSRLCYEYACKDCRIEVSFSEKTSTQPPVPIKIVQRFEAKDVKIVFELKRWKAVNEYLTLPTEVSRRIWKSGKEVATAELTLTQLNVNGLSPDDFKLGKPEGSILLNEDDGTQSFQPGGFDLLDQLIEFGKSQVPSNHSANKFSNKTAAILVSIFGFAFFVSNIFLSRGTR